MIWDTFMFNDELDILEMRLLELESIPDLIHVAVEADVDHQDHPKPYRLTENLDRFAPWADRIRIVRATGLPTHAANPDPWAREHAQREWIREALTDANADDVVLQSDVDEIPTALAARNVKPQRYVAFTQRLHAFAVDWQHPHPWKGTVAARLRNIVSFGQMRDVRNIAPAIPNAGWHFSWLGGGEANLRKLGSFCHPEIAGRTYAGLQADAFMAEGFHVDGVKMLPVEVDGTYPRFIREGRAPASWYRPRVESTGWTPPTGLEAS